MNYLCINLYIDPGIGTMRIKRLYNKLMLINQSIKKLLFRLQNPMYICFIFFTMHMIQKKYQQEGSQGNKPGGSIDNLVFTPNPCPFQAGDKGIKDVLYVDDGACILPKNIITLVADIKWGDGSDAFKVVALK